MAIFCLIGKEDKGKEVQVERKLYRPKEKAERDKVLGSVKSLGVVRFKRIQSRLVINLRYWKVQFSEVNSMLISLVLMFKFLILI